jgi:hypothetical protein
MWILVFLFQHDIVLLFVCGFCVFCAYFAYISVGGVAPFESHPRVCACLHTLDFGPRFCGRSSESFFWSTYLWSIFSILFLLLAVVDDYLNFQHFVQPIFCVSA